MLVRFDAGGVNSIWYTDGVNLVGREKKLDGALLDRTNFQMDDTNGLLLAAQFLRHPAPFILRYPAPFSIGYFEQAAARLLRVRQISGRQALIDPNLLVF